MIFCDSHVILWRECLLDVCLSESLSFSLATVNIQSQQSVLVINGQPLILLETYIFYSLQSIPTK